MARDAFHSNDMIQSCTKAEDLLDLPKDGIDRALIRGQLVEYPMVGDTPHYRDRLSAGLLPRLCSELLNWLERQREPRGDVFADRVGCVLDRNPDTAVGVDVAFFSAQQMRRQPANAPLLVGAPTLAIEIVSSLKTKANILPKIDELLSAGSPLVWLVEPLTQTISVFQVAEPIQHFTSSDTISADPFLPGFTLPVIQLFS